ncbi:hypothetical protein, conserved [Trypanosoma brucei brucei TREU927]|uniref:NAD(P)-binding domain-containing protein n=1 Tax=Trypanosoma brucei brucei (strain 927/4 GUTat10.1) TaxID=185431 RepID=Q57YG3_TRYB2|nr:hypothetical protein, conserved [Trypanosoma brucei brucei TREU927]AAX69355.1 hypothetical protein, conserved [Trypanosoma brucei]AAZ12838.1 hypothetical protein, conserved [Trypanosoma brucei brucei TREU927]
MSLLVAGATGAIGRRVVFEALRREEFIRVAALTRSCPSEDVAALFGFSLEGINGNKTEKEASSLLTREQIARLHTVTFDWEDFCRFWEEQRENADKTHRKTQSSAEVRYRDIFSGHTYVAMCLGTTRRDAGSATKFKRCDYDYVVAFAEAVKRFSGSTLLNYAQVSAQLANKNSCFLYPQTKGRADASVEELQLSRLSIYRPGLLDRAEKTRAVEKIAKWFVRGLPVETCGKAIVIDFLHCSDVVATEAETSTSSVHCAGKKQELSQRSGVVCYFGNNEIIKEASALSTP